MSKKNKPQAEMAAPISEVMDKDEIDPNGYEVKDAADTLMRAEDIKKNKKLMPHVHRHLNQKMNSLKALKRLAVEKDMAENEPDEDDMPQKKM